MFSILIVEDVDNTLEELSVLLKETFPGSLIETATNVKDGSGKIGLAVDNNKAFDVAILDFKLPASRGENPEIDESLCKEIKDKIPETLVIHITAYLKDEKVTKHVAEFHAGKNAPRVELVEKTVYWPEKLLAEMRSYLYSSHVNSKLTSLFDGKPFSQDAKARKLEGTRGSRTHELAALSREIRAYWDDLDVATKSRVRRFFTVIEEEGQVHVSLLVDFEPRD